MPTRRQFIGAAAAGLAPMTLHAFAPLAGAQTPPRPSPRDAVIAQLVAEMGRTYQALRSGPVRGEHCRAGASALRLMATLDLDAEVEAAVRRTVASRGRPWLLQMPLDTGEVASRLRRFGFDLGANDLVLGDGRAEDRARVLDTMLAGRVGYSDALGRLAAALEAAGARLAVRETPGFLAAQYEYCDDWEEYVVYLQFGLVALCVSGNVFGCIGSAASIAVVSWSLIQLGC